MAHNIKIKGKGSLIPTFWRIYSLLCVFIQLIYGIFKISRASMPMVTIFGGSRMIKTEPPFSKAFEFAEMLVAHNISVLTGGGGGIMEAASCGAKEKRNTDAKSIGIGVTNLDHEKNQCVDIYFSLDYFFARKWLLVNYSRAFVFFPGGFGTLDELFEVLTQIQTHNLERTPVILIGNDYWQPLLAWMYNQAGRYHLIDKEELQLFIITDDIHQAFSIIKKQCQIC